MIKIQELYNEYNIDTAPSGNKHYRHDWVNTHCPHCSGSNNYHLGFNINSNHFHCWRCGGHQIVDTLSKLLGINKQQVKMVLSEYSTDFYTPSDSAKKVKPKKKAFKLPPLTKPLNTSPIHLRYLKNRGFSTYDIARLQSVFDIQCTGPVSNLKLKEKQIDLSFRIVIPFMWKGENVSWTSRDITGKSKLKYLSCPQVIEKIDHKHTLYQYKKFPETDWIVLCEGCFDVWKVDFAGFPSTCTFGIDLTINQFKELMKYRKVIVFFDSEKQANQAANKLVNRLLFSGVQASKAPCPDGEDPGSLSAKEIQQIIEPLI